MKTISLFLFIALSISVLTACEPAPAAPIAIAAQSPTETATPVPSPTATYTPVPPFEGRLFFDMNGSGLPDEASFIYDTVRLAYSRQPLQSDLDKSIDDYVSAHPDLKNGDIMTIEEPGLSNYTVCVQANCAQTDAEGNFSLSNPSGASRAGIKITDPNADTPALAMRYINDWKGPVVIPAYEMNGVQVPEQHLNDTTVIPLGDGIFITLGADNKVGLMQGFRTYTLPTEAVMNVVYITGYDHDPNKGKVISFAGDTYYCAESPFCNPISSILKTPIFKFGGIFDSHPAYDYFFPNNNDLFDVLAGMPGVFNSWICNGLCASESNNIPGLGSNVVGVHGHVYKVLLEPQVKVYRGQIIGLTGEIEYKLEHPDYYGQVQLSHYEFGLRYGPVNPPEPDDYLPPTSDYKDPYAVVDSDVHLNFPDLEKYSSWTVFNIPVFP